MRPLKVMASRTGSTLLALDIVLIAVVWPLLLWVVWDSIAGGDPAADTRVLLYPAANLVMLYAMGLHRREAILETRKSLARLPLVVGLGLAGAMVAHYLLGFVVPPSGPVDQAPMFVAAGGAFLTCGAAARLLLHALLSRGVFRRRLMVVGSGQRAAELMATTRQHGSHLHYDIVFVHDAVLGPRDPDVGRGAHQTVVTAIDSNYLQLAIAHDVDQIVVAPDERRGMRLDKLLDCKKNGFPVVQYLGFIEKEARRIDLKWVELGWILYSEGFHFGAIDRALKRSLDVLVSIVVLALGSPLLLGAAIAIKWQDGGPVFYAQTRLTRNCKPFRILKLRTMRIDAERDGAVWAAASDQRITAVGRFLRHSRIDEIPQLLNVLRGDMSLVGPRPERPEFTGELAEKIPLYNERHTVKAGLTGWAQINYPYGASIEDSRAKLSYDLYYVKNFSILFDMLIILQTLRVVLFPSGAR